jgi:hypothetical protein
VAPTLQANLHLSMERGMRPMLGTGNRLCGLVVGVPGYRSRGPGSIPAATRFSEK